MSSDPMGYTADHFRDVEKLELDPHFRDYMSQAFSPLGVYLSFWQPALTAGDTLSLQVMMVNDERRLAEGTLIIALEAPNGEQVARKSTTFSLAPLGQQTYYVDFVVPRTTGSFLLEAIADPADKRLGGPTLSRRRVSVVEKTPDSN
jgi:beta-galactosidase